MSKITQLTHSGFDPRQPCCNASAVSHYVLSETEMLLVRMGSFCIDNPFVLNAEIYGRKNSDPRVAKEEPPKLDNVLWDDE